MTNNPLDVITFHLKITDPMGETLVKVGLPLAEGQQHEIKKLFKKLSLDSYEAIDIEVSLAGLDLHGAGGVFRYVPQVGWQETICKFDKDLSVKGFAAVDLVSLWYKEYLVEQNAQLALKHLREGKITFEELRELVPQIFDHPQIQEALAQAFSKSAMPKRKKGRRPKPQKGELELYYYVCRYVRDGMAMDNACTAALAAHDEHIPGKWEKDKLEALKKAVKRFDEHPRLSHKSWRESQDG